MYMSFTIVPRPRRPVECGDLRTARARDVYAAGWWSGWATAAEMLARDLREIQGAQDPEIAAAVLGAIWPPVVRRLLRAVARGVIRL